jgi:hypothetical protein
MGASMISALPLFGLAVGCSLAAGCLCFVLSRLVFHPLARFPGPKIAALTSLYEDFHEVHGSANYDYIWRIQKMHDRYGKCELATDAPW